jgi:hypothetical protein
MAALLRRMAQRGALSGTALRGGLQEAADLRFSYGDGGSQLR